MSPEEIAALADQVLRRNAQRTPPVDVDAIARNEGLTFGSVRLEKISGGYYRDLDGHGHAIITELEHPLRQRFTKAHELGHHLLDERTPGHALTPSAYRDRRRHWAQDYFAGCLLMPRPWVANFFRVRGVGLGRDELILETARRFRVSRSAATVRLQELGLIERAAL
jgi:Zn-dependent peptidase ImmA (M78 family)